ncbi:DUF6357 family protein [Clavibacter sp. Sh2141]|uniref:DUF6357 family protein n=1 Tax=Clavibacter sp. Sh2141 TaxID=3395374 RepID=UPI0039BD0AED
MAEIVLARDRWLPRVLDDAGALLLEVVGGADALHDPRTFTVPIGAEHVGSLRESVPRHLLLHGAMLPLCDAAGIGGPWDEGAAAALLDPILLGTPQEVDTALRGVRVARRALIAHHASIAALDRRDYFEAMRAGTVAADWARVRAHEGV